MPIKEIFAPGKSIDIFKNWVSKHKLGRPRMRPHKYHETVPHKVFHVSLNDIVSEKGLTNAVLVSWRHLHTDTRGNHALIEVRVGETEEEHFLQEAHFGPATVEHKSLLSILKGLELLEKEDFELAYLRIYTLKINAIWLRAAKRENDYFRPLVPCFYGLTAGQLYASHDFLKIVQDATQRFYKKAEGLNMDDLKAG